MHKKLLGNIAPIILVMALGAAPAVAAETNSANGTATNEAFTFIGSQAFHHTAGELRSEVVGGNTYVTGDTDGDGIADFMIRLDGTHALVGADFVL